MVRRYLPGYQTHLSLALLLYDALPTVREFGKFVPAFAAFEKNRLSLYREAAKEAEEIFDRWADEIDDLDEDFMEDEDYEPGEYYSD